jgi:zinc transport system substrate-binding protein
MLRRLFLPIWLALTLGGATHGADADDRLLVAASILPLADFTREVGGERTAVEVLVPPGASPHTYEFTPAQLRLVSRARVLVLNGVGLEFWAGKMISAARNPKLMVVRTAEGLNIIKGDADEPGGNPHVWLSPVNAIHQVQMIRDTLIRADPAGADLYRTNAARYIGKLHALDREIRAAVATFSQRAFIAFHPAWAYLARDYGLREAAVIESTPGAEPSPAQIARVIRMAKTIGAKAIFAEPQFPTQAAQVIAAESGAQVLFLNPLGLPPHYAYLDLMRYNLAQMRKALR